MSENQRIAAMRSKVRKAVRTFSIQADAPNSRALYDALLSRLERLGTAHLFL
jgi:hypothetical protein